MNEPDITRSLIHWFDSQYSGTIDYEKPTKFDPTKDDLQQWIDLCLTNCKQTPRRLQSELKSFTFTLHVSCWTRKSGNIYAGDILAGEVADIIRTANDSIYVKDYDESDEPNVGVIRLREPKIMEIDVDDNKYTLHKVTVEGTVEELP